MGYEILENYTAKFSQYYYKIGHSEINLSMFYNKLLYPINSIINKRYVAWLEKVDAIDTLGSTTYVWVNDQFLGPQKQKKVKK